MADGKASGNTSDRARPLVGLSLMPDDDFLAAAFPLFEKGEVEILEWSFDTGWPPAVVPRWAHDLIEAFSDQGRLVGHGVSFSPLSAGVDELQVTWLLLLGEEVRRRRYRHISEHFGFSSTRNFHQSAPLPVPLTDVTLQVGIDNMRKLAEVANAPVGLENLAFAFSARDVENQGRFLDALLDPVDGFLLFDLHNLYCQAQNFNRSLDELLPRYPLSRVRELHVAGGSWSPVGADPNTSPIRRDTHDGPVPEEIFEWLRRVLGACPNVEAVILERMGGTLPESEADALRRDFLRLKEVVHGL